MGELLAKGELLACGSQPKMFTPRKGELLAVGVGVGVGHGSNCVQHARSNSLEHASNLLEHAFNWPAQALACRACST